MGEVTVSRHHGTGPAQVAPCKSQPGKAGLEESVYFPQCFGLITYYLLLSRMEEGREKVKHPERWLSSS